MSSMLPIHGGLRPQADAGGDDGGAIDPRRVAAQLRRAEPPPLVSPETLSAQPQDLVRWLEQGPSLELGALPSRDLSNTASSPMALPAIDPAPADREHVLERRAETTAVDWLGSAHGAAQKPPTATPPQTIGWPNPPSRSESGDFERD